MTIDEEFKKLGEDKINILDHTRDSCDKENTVTITSTTDGDVELLPSQTRYFRIKKIRQLHKEWRLVLEMRKLRRAIADRGCQSRQNRGKGNPPAAGSN